MNKTYLMKCGHVANAKRENDSPCCVICMGIRPGWNEIEENIPDLSKRKATCSYCGHIADSSLNLPFFSIHPDREFDDYYCGCRGWN